jgi:hypothetical protein
MGKDKVYIPPVAAAMAYMGCNRKKFDPSAKMKNSVSSYYTVFLHPFRYQEGFEIEIYVKFGKLHLLWMIKII